MVMILKRAKITALLLALLLALALIPSCGGDQGLESSVADAYSRVEYDESSMEAEASIVSETSETAGGLLEVYFLDVGQGDCIFIATPSGGYMLIDSGTLQSKEYVLSFLREKGVEELEYLFLTHPHADHIGGADDIIKSFTVKKVYMPNAVTTTQVYERLLDALEENKDVNVIRALAGQHIVYDGLSLEIISPKKDSYSNLNLYSIVLRMTYGEKSFLFTGDAEIPNEREMLDAEDILAAHVLKIGHHGSLSSTSAEFLAAVAPEIAVICCGAGNSYGHPHAQTIEKLNSITVYRTDLNGTITVFCDGKELFAEPSR